MDKRTVYVVVLSAFLFVASACWYLPRTYFWDDAYFGGDTWEYQSMAVNFAFGHGLRFGAIEDFAVYKFFVPPEARTYYKQFFQEGENGGTLRTYRTWGYPLFLGIVYKFFGVHPAVAKRIQLLMLLAVAASLPLIGYSYYGNAGLLAGLIVFPGVTISFVDFADEILTKSLIVVALFSWLLVYMSWNKKKSLLSATCLGMMTGPGMCVVRNKNNGT